MASRNIVKQISEVVSSHSDVGLSSAVIEQLFDRCPLGMIELDAASKILRANKAALEICGLGTDNYAGVSIQDFLPDKTAVEIFQKHFAQRLEGASDEYDVEFLRQNGTRVPVRVVGVPIKDSNKNVVGSMGILRSLRLEKAAADLDGRIEAAETAQHIFCAIAEEVAKLEPYDLLSAWVYSEDLTQARDLFTYDRHGIFRWPKRWYKILPQQIQWIQDHVEPGVNPEFEAMRHEYAVAMKDQSIGELMQHLRSAYRIPVVRNARVIGSIGVFREAKDAFDHKADENLRSLPLKKAFLVAWAYLEREELRFTNELTKQLAAYRGRDLFDRRIAELIVRRLSEHHGWEAVSIFRVNREQKRFDLEAQAGRPEVLVVQPFNQSFGRGVLWSAYLAQKDICIPDWRDDAVFEPVFIPAFKGTVSELCMPIRVDDETVAMLNVEDSRQNAVSAAERDWVRDLLNQVSEKMQARRDEQIAEVAFEATPSAVLMVGEDGRISRVNQSALKILGYTNQELNGKALAEVLQPEVHVAPMLRVDTPWRDDLQLVKKGGAKRKVIVASSRLGGGMGAIVSAKDITGQRRIIELDYLEQLFYEVAAQTRVPLALASAWLRRLRHGLVAATDLPQPAAMADELDKTMKQLRKAEITYDRLALYDHDLAGGVPRNPVAIRIDRLLQDVKAEFPANEAARLMIRSADVLGSYVVADEFQVSFALLATVAYSLRFMPESGNLSIDVAKQIQHGREWVAITIWAIVPPSEKGAKRRQADRMLAQARTEIALGTRVIKTFVQQNGGLYQHPDRLEGKVKFCFQFPIAAVAA